MCWLTPATAVSQRHLSCAHHLRSISGDKITSSGNVSHGRKTCQLQKTKTTPRNSQETSLIPTTMDTPRSRPLPRQPSIPPLAKPKPLSTTRGRATLRAPVTTKGRATPRAPTTPNNRATRNRDTRNRALITPRHTRNRAMPKAPAMPKPRATRKTPPTATSGRDTPKHRHRKTQSRRANYPGSSSR